MKVIEKTITFEDYNYVEGSLELKIAGDRLFESRFQEQFSISDILSSTFVVFKKYIAPKVPKGIMRSKISTLNIPNPVLTITKTNKGEQSFHVDYDEIICDDQYVSDDGYLIIDRFNTVKEGSRIYSTIRVKAYGLKKKIRKETEIEVLYEIFPEVWGRGDVRVIPKKPYYQLGEKVQIKAIPKRGFDFLSWGGDFKGKSSEEKEVEITIKEDVKFQANFEQPKPRRPPWPIPEPDRQGCLASVGSGIAYIMALFGYLLIAVYILAIAYFLIVSLGWLLLFFIGIIILSWMIPYLLNLLARSVFIKDVLNVFIFGLILLGLIQFFSQLPNTSLPKEVVDYHPETIEKELDNNTFDYIHYLKWQDYEGIEYETYVKVNSDLVAYEQEVKAAIRPVETLQEYNYLLKRLSEISEESLRPVIQSLDSIKKSNSLNQDQFADVIVSMVQHIPYHIILPESCNPLNYADVGLRQQLNSSPCQGGISHGVKSPAEFLKDLKGDCDSRTLLLYSLLHSYGYDVAIFGSQQYNHSLLGVAGINTKQKIPYKEINNTRYWLWETTNIGYQLGFIPSEIDNMNYWQLNLN